MVSPGGKIFSEIGELVFFQSGISTHRRLLKFFVTKIQGGRFLGAGNSNMFYVHPLFGKDEAIFDGSHILNQRGW